MVASFALVFLTWVGFVVNLLLAGFLLMGLHKVYQVRHEIQWEARHFRPLYYAVLLTIVFIAVERNIQLFGTVSGYFDLGTQLRWILNNFFTLGFLFAYGLRVWIVHFDYHAGVAMLVQITNLEVGSLENREQFNWFLLNKTYYGSPRYLLQFLSIMVILLTLAIWGWIVVSEETFYYGMFVIYIVVILILISITNKIILVNDLLFIRREILLQFRMLAGFFMVLGILIIFGSAMGWDYCAFFVIEASVFTMTGMATISTWWVLEKSELFTLPLLMQKRLKELGKAEEDEDVKNAPPLRIVLNDQDAITDFLRHLIKELSLENIFFLADVMNYKNSFMENLQVFDTCPGFSVRIQKMARYGYQPNRTFIEYAWALSHAYVENISASFVTAIHDDTRERILDYLSELNPQEQDNFNAEQWTRLCTIFDQAAEEVWLLLKQSWQRYVKSPDYVKPQLSQESDRQRTLTTEMVETFRKKQGSKAEVNVTTVSN